MNWLEPILGLVLILLAAGMMFVFSLPQRGRSRFVLRPLRPMQHLRRAIGLAVEDGTRLHITLGKASIISPLNASALVGLIALERIGILSSISDRPPVATSGDGTLALLSQDALRASYRISNALEQYDPAQARLTGPTPFSYIVGALPIVHDERISANIMVGNFGPEVALLTEAAERENAFNLAASDAFTAQAVIYASAQEPLIGEELFAIPAYLQAGAIQQASLRVQDVLRWVIAGALIIGAVFTFIQSL